MSGGINEEFIPSSSRCLCLSVCMFVWGGGGEGGWECICVGVYTCVFM